MAKTQPPDDHSGRKEIEITVVVVPGRFQAMLSRFSPSRRLRAGLVTMALIGAISAGAIIAVSSSGGTTERRLDPGALASRLGLRLTCGELTILSPGGGSAHIDLHRGRRCEPVANHVIVITPRAHGVWLRESEAPISRCPPARLPHRVAFQLHFCGPAPTRDATFEIPLNRRSAAALMSALARLH
jgi:hypothetical protein